MTEVPPELKAKFNTVFRRAFERHVLHLVQGYGVVQDNRFREAHDGASPITIFVRAELDGEYPDTCVVIYAFDRARVAELNSRQVIWDPEFAEGDVVEDGYMRSPEYIAETILARARGEEVADLTIASASDTEWRDKYAAVERRAFELRVLDLIQGASPLQQSYERNSHGFFDSIIFLRADLENEYPKTRVVIYVYHRSLECEQCRGYWIWDSDYANGDVADVEHMRSPGWIYREIMMYARGG